MNVGDGGMWRGLGVMPAAVLGYCDPNKTNLSLPPAPIKDPK